MSVKNLAELFVSTIIGSKKNSNEVPSKKSGSEVKEENGYYIWNKGENVALSPYFTSKEFTCKCNFPACKKQRVSKTMIVRLDLLRKEAKQPLVVTSAFRCFEHQAFLRSSGIKTAIKQSTHELGQAADVVPKDGNIQALLLLAEKHFDSIGVSKSFLHLDLRNGKRRWDY